MLSPPPVDLSWAPIPSSMIHEHWSSLMTRAGLQPKPSVEVSSELTLSLLGAMSPRCGRCEAGWRKGDIRRSNEL
ncbi:Elongation factor 2 [Dissostichus eleginoides]|uniref:Elongation factor 2 n=1 Tax=Dissostichus eleginoides TaxID=100907 RepID=A0AAD9CQT9_DISEL|nr:Elongation factor 2 [Dissostichus eleginoides]